MDKLVFLQTAALAFLPISELRGAIPFALVRGIPWQIAYPFSAAVNALVAPGCWLFLSSLHRLFMSLSRRRGFRWYASFFEKFINRARAKLHGGVEKWGWLGVALFVAIPLPLTGAWTGCFGAWALGLDRFRTIAAVIVGVAVAGGIVTLAATLGIEAFRVFLA